MTAHRTLAASLFLALTTGCGLDIQLVESDGEEAPLADDTGLDDADDSDDADDYDSDDADGFDDTDGFDDADDSDDADGFGDADAPEGADEELEEEVEESDWIYESVVFLDLSTHDPEFPSGDVSDTCEGAFTLTVDADGVVTGEATCRQATYANHVSLSVDAEVVGPDIVGDGTITYNGRSFDFPIEGMFAEDQLTIRIETSWSPTARLTQVFEGGIEGLR